MPRRNRTTSQAITAPPGVTFETDPAALRLHPAAQCVPPMTAEAFDSLMASINASGQQEPVLLSRDGRIVDGVHRVRACHELERSVICRTVDWTDDECVAQSLRINVQRRHLSTSQRALAAAKMVDTTRGAHVGPAQISQAMAASMFTVSVRYIREAQRLLAASAGEVDAETLAHTPPPEQVEQLIDEVWRGARSLHSALALYDINRAPPRPEPINIDPAPEQPTMPDAPRQTMDARPGARLMSGLAPVLSGEIDGAAFVHYLEDTGISIDERRRMLVVLDEFARRAYDTADEEGAFATPEESAHADALAAIRSRAGASGGGAATRTAPGASATGSTVRMAGHGGGDGGGGSASDGGSVDF